MPDDSLLAIDGGPPVLPAGPPSWPPRSEAVRAALERAGADGSWGRYGGPHGERLAAELAVLCGVRQSWLCSSGTIAVELALRGLKLGAGDEVILAAYDFPGNFRAIEAVGARPVLVDLAGMSAESFAWHLDPAQVTEALSPATKAILVSHLHGSLADLRTLREIADRAAIALVEDACQVPGAMVRGRPAGSWGDVGVLSFGGSKLLTAGRGGALVTNRDDVLQRIKVFSQRGNEAFPLSELQAAVLVPQLAELADANERRLAAAGRLLAQCGQLPGMIPLELDTTDGNEPAFYKLPWLLTGNDDACDSPAFEQRRRRFIAAIQAEGVAMDEGFRGFARRTTGRCRVVGELPQARRAAAGTVLLHHPVLLEAPETIDRVAVALRKVAAELLSD
ncbi:MAG: aminotransferase class I/II-fold pyridoxal phosphate-dependent enzyme [Pirellulaceae bacterium]|nr:aminotransferase class I/II-fold pyridoxal phosphate-dependent enzyme [Pirellulaceae bacterium]